MPRRVFSSSSMISMARTLGAPETVPAGKHDINASKQSTSSRNVPRKLERSEEHTSELQSPDHLVCRLLLEKKKTHRQLRTRHAPHNSRARTTAASATP